MKYYSTLNSDQSYSSRTAALLGIAPDGGLFIPEEYPTLDRELVETLSTADPLTLGAALLGPYFNDSLSAVEIHDCIAQAITFPTPLVYLDDSLAVLELFQGPTCAFKDYGARTMAQIISRLRKPEEELTILVATSGDTGGAVAAGFHGVSGIRVVILYPSARVSPLQEKQLTTWGGNVHALEVEGTFDDCQRLVKEAFLEPDLAKAYQLTSANSINIARFLPQMLYYAWGLQQVREHSAPIMITVPSGNLGNLTSGLIARAMGLPIAHFCCASNANNSAVEYLNGKPFVAKSTIQTLSNAMDVGNPSNFPRLCLAQIDRSADIRKSVSGLSFSDTQTIASIRHTKRSYGYTADPHTAVGLAAAEVQRKQFPEATHIVLGTAHPAKFAEVMQQAEVHSYEIPEQLAALLSGKKNARLIQPTLGALRLALENMAQEGIV